MWKVSMFQVQELVRLHRMGVSCHEVARLLGVTALCGVGHATVAQSMILAARGGATEVIAQHCSLLHSSAVEHVRY